MFLVTPVRVYRDSLAGALAGEGLCVVGAHGGGGDLIAHVVASRPDIVILDVAVGRSIAAARDVQRALPAAAVVALGVRESKRELLTYAEAGVTGYVATDASLSVLITTIETAARGELLCSPALMRELIQRVAALTTGCAPALQGARLTAREQQIADLLEQDLSNQEIAAGLAIEVSTVKHHVHNLLRKIGVRRRSDAVVVLKRAQKGVPTLIPRTARRNCPVGLGS